MERFEWRPCLEGQQQINALMDKLRRNIPDVIAGLKVIAVEDYETLSDR
jgi:phosphoglucomutase